MTEETACSYLRLPPIVHVQEGVSSISWEQSSRYRVPSSKQRNSMSISISRIVRRSSLLPQMDSIHFESPNGPTLLDEPSLSALAILTGRIPLIEDGWICIPDRALRSSAAASDKTGIYPWRFASIQLIEHLGLRSDVAEEILCRWQVAQGDPSCEFHGLPIVHTVMAFIKQKRNEMDLLADGKGRDWYSALHELGADRDMIDMIMDPEFNSRRLQFLAADWVEIVVSSRWAELVAMNNLIRARGKEVAEGKEVARQAEALFSASQREDGKTKSVEEGEKSAGFVSEEDPQSDEGSEVETSSEDGMSSGDGSEYMD